MALTDPSPRPAPTHAPVIWLTGLSGAGKSTLAAELTARMRAKELRVEWLDGDVVRGHLCRYLGFSRDDRHANVLRIAFVASLLARNGVTVVVSAISPYRESRDAARQMVARFVEVHVAPPLEVCAQRDVKGLYKRAFAGELDDFTGVSDPYEAPLSAEVTVDTSALAAAAAADHIEAYLRRHEGSLNEAAISTRRPQ
jgi:adenylylsulfate kinase